MTDAPLIINSTEGGRESCIGRSIERYREKEREGKRAGKAGCGKWTLCDPD